MADNRMYLIHLPSGLSVPLGKRVGEKWHLNGADQALMGDRVAQMFELLNSDKASDAQDDFAVGLERPRGATLAVASYERIRTLLDKPVQMTVAPPAEKRSEVGYEDWKLNWVFSAVLAMIIAILLLH